MNSFELEMKLLAAKPIEIEGTLAVHKVSFNNICDIGYKKYNSIIGLLCTSDLQIKKYLKLDDVDIYQYIASLAHHAALEPDIDSSKFVYDILTVLKYIFKADEVKFDIEKSAFIINGVYTLNQRNYTEFAKIIKLRNCIENIEAEADNPDSERTRNLLERRKQLREQLNKTKSNSDVDALTILDLISIYAVSSHMKLEDIFDYDIYQFNNQFNRLKIFKDYDVNIHALLAGAKKEDLDFKHWLSRISQ